MDDFLHNLRSGKLKQSDRSNRSYGDPQYKNKRNMMDRRKREHEAKESERLGAIKELLESVSETQLRMAELYEVRIKAEERKAKALEILAKSLYRMANPKAKDADELFAFVDPDQTETDNDVDAGDSGKSRKSKASDEMAATADADQNKLNAGNRKKLFKLIQRMRDDGISWEKIARQIASQGFPTVSGRGSWRGVMVKNLYEKMNR
jgi:uncharacterized protein YfiM (DUF2279 family)